MKTVKEILSSATLYGHLILRLVFIWLITGLGHFLLTVAIFWLVFFKGASANYVYQIYLTKFMVFFIPLFFGLFFAYRGILKNMGGDHLSKAKSYLIAGLLLIIIYPFRTPIINAIVNLLQR